MQLYTYKLTKFKQSFRKMCTYINSSMLRNVKQRPHIWSLSFKNEEVGSVGLSYYIRTHEENWFVLCVNLVLFFWYHLQSKM